MALEDTQLSDEEARLLRANSVLGEDDDENERWRARYCEMVEPAFEQWLERRRAIR